MSLLSSLLLLLNLFQHTVFAAPHDLLGRNISTPVAIITSIISSSTNNSNNTNGALSAPSFRTLLYLPPPTVALPSLTGRTPAFTRLLHNCRSPTAVFHHSHCLHDPRQAGGMQRYVIYCRERPLMSWHHQHTPRPLGEAGMCTADEICVNSWIGEAEYSYQMARCIAKKAFESLDSIDDDDTDDAKRGGGQGREQGSEPMDIDGKLEGDDSGHRGGEKRRKLVDGFVLGGKQASVVVSKEDGVTPLGVGSMEVDSVVDGDTTLVEKTCRDCFELRTKDLSSDTDRLNMEATLVTAGTGVAAGVMWVALLSG